MDGSHAECWWFKKKSALHSWTQSACTKWLAIWLNRRTRHVWSRLRFCRVAQMNNEYVGVHSYKISLLKFKVESKVIWVLSWWKFWTFDSKSKGKIFATSRKTVIRLNIWQCVIAVKAEPESYGKEIQKGSYLCGWRVLTSEASCKIFFNTILLMSVFSSNFRLCTQ